jgi:DNA-binding IscR family transcriptional regulator
MPTSTRFAVATHILTALAVTDGKPLRSEDLANSVNTGAVVIRGLLSRLAEAGLTRSQLGSGGGALLAKSPNEIRLLDVYRAVGDTTFRRSPPAALCGMPGGGEYPCGHQPRADKCASGNGGGTWPHHHCRRCGARKRGGTGVTPGMTRYTHTSNCMCIYYTYT